MYIKSPINTFSNLNKYTGYLKNINGFICGGCFKNIFKNEKVKDIDIFFYTSDDFENALEEYEDNYRYKHKYENDNCVAFYDNKNDIVIELVRSIFGTPDEILNQFDFTIVKASLVKIKTTSSATDILENISKEEEDNFEFEFLYHSKFFEHLMCNKLVIDDKIPKSVATLNRVFKYISYGYGLCRESKTKLVQDIIDNGNVVDINNDLYFGFD